MKEISHNSQEVLQLIKDEKVSFLLGNGYNLHIREKNQHALPSWDELVKEICDSLNLGCNDIIGQGGITNPELFSAISIAYNMSIGMPRHSILPIHEAVANILKKNTKENQAIKQFASSLLGFGRPVITTNYDLNLETSLELKQFRQESNPSKSRYYPVDMYYGTNKVHRLDDSFAIWHCHGSVDLIESLRLDLSDYCNYTAWLKKCIPMYGETVEKENVFLNSWLYPFFNNKLIIIGLRLDPSEFILRWLLLRRYVWRRIKHPDDIVHGFYVCADSIEKGKEDYLKTVGISVVRYNSWEKVYGELFGL